MPSLLGAKLAVARGAGALARLARRRGRRAYPGRVLMALEPHAIGTLGARLPRRQRGDLGDQRQDDDGRDGGGRGRARPGSRSCTTAPARTWRAASRPRCSTRRTARGIVGEMGLFEVDELWLASVAAALAPRAIVLGNLFRDQLDRFGELEAIADSWAELLDAPPRGRS